jgi:hypothetical protein
MLDRAETEIYILIANGKFNKKINIDRHALRLLPNTRQHLDPPYFSLPTTFKKVDSLSST